MLAIFLNFNFSFIGFGRWLIIFLEASSEQIVLIEFHMNYDVSRQLLLHQNHLPNTPTDTGLKINWFGFLNYMP